MKLLIHMTHDDIRRKLPYAIIAETTSRSIWNTGRRKRMFVAEFTEAERRRCAEIRRQAYSWALVRGVPMKGVTMSMATYDTWQKFGNFCGRL